MFTRDPVVVVEKALSAEQARWYLELGHDRAGGEVRVCGPSPAAAPGEGFFLRWPAHVLNLYRPIGDNRLTVSSIALPHGATLHASSSEHPVARFDAGLLTWNGVPGRQYHDRHRDGYVARWRGTEYDARPAEDAVHLFAPVTDEGFEEIGPGRHRRIVPADEVESLRYARTLGQWRGLPVLVIGEHGGWLRVEHAEPAETIPPGFDQVDGGIWQGWARGGDVEELHELLI